MNAAGTSGSDTGAGAAGGGAVGEGAAGGRAGRPPRRVVISSVTGKPIPWGEPEQAPAQLARERRPILPNRVDEDAPEPGADESNDARIAGDVPPHWGRGR